jgi:adenosylcobinamide-phosphate synthase
LLLWIALASALAGRSLEQAVRDVLRALPDLAEARTALSWIVGRDTTELSQAEIVRAAAETASENAVDGLFAPLFWMLVGAGLWSAGLSSAPGPLALTWGFKAASTLDSMLGYRQGRLQWLGTAGARLDDLLVWLPCRLVALSLPLAAGAGPGGCFRGLASALRDGAPDPSPNAGVSQAAYAHAAGVQLGGLNRYGDQFKAKPLLAAGQPRPSAESVERMLALTGRLELLWLLPIAALAVGTQ